MRIRRRQDAGLGELRRAERIVELRYRVFLRAVQRRELLRIGVGDFLKHDAELLDVVEPEQRLDLAGAVARLRDDIADELRSEEHTSELQSLMRISYAVFCLKKKKNYHNTTIT